MIATSKVPPRVLNAAIRAAERADHEFRIGAVVYYKDWIMGTGCNKPNKTHPLSKTPYQRIHAELAAILATQRNYTPGALKGCSIYVHRIGLAGEPRMSKPCPSCAEMLDQLGIKDVKWSV